MDDRYINLNSIIFSGVDEEQSQQLQGSKIASFAREILKHILNYVFFN